MFWEELTGDQFPHAVEQAQGVCLLPTSCIERHAHHLPLGTDMYIARELCRRAVEIEPAVIFPNFFFTQILEARHYPGTVAVEPDLFLRLLDSTCREIARNGLNKIAIVNAHGGNDYLIHFFSQIQLSEPRAYVVYVLEPPLAPDDKAALSAQWQTSIDGHAGEMETSEILVIRPDLVHKEALSDAQEGLPLNRLKALRELGIDTGIWWYADHPTHYRGDGGPATVEKGELLLAAQARALAQAIHAIKADHETRRLQDEFFARSRQHGINSTDDNQ